MALRPKLSRIWASTSSTLRRDPGDAKYIQGWISEIPTYQVLNYLQYKVDTTMLAQAERGIFEWGSDVQYQLGSLVWDEIDKKIYVSTVGNPSKTLAPSANLTQWSPSSIQITRLSYDNIVAAINAHIADVTGNPHKLTAGRLNAYNKAEIDAIVAQYRALVAAHASDKNNPHGVTATQIGAVPITGGTYTGDVTFNGGLFFDASKTNQISKTNGLYLQSGTFILGLNASGQAVAGTTSSQSPLVTEATFPTLKAAREPQYAVPEPTLKASLINSIHLQAGSGMSNADWTPGYSPTLGALIMATDVKRILQTDQVQVPPSNTTWTIAVDVAFNGSLPAIPGNTNIAIGIGVYGKGAIYIRNDGTVYGILASGAGTASVDLGNMTSWTRLVLVSAGSNCLLYVNGVLAANITNGTQGTTGGAAYIQTYVNTGQNARQAWVRNWRIWQSDALSAAMVSTL